MFELEAPFKNDKILLKCIKLGNDYQVIISGGDEHIGAVALGVCYDRVKKRSNISQLAVYGHKEDLLVQNIAALLSRQLAATVAVTAGIHFDNLSSDEIDKILEIVEDLATRLIGQLQRGPA